MKHKKKLDELDFISTHPECSHNWVHYVREQFESDIPDTDKYGNPKRLRDSNNVAYMYLCTMCQDLVWSSDKLFDIPHYRLKERRKNANHKNT